MPKLYRIACFNKSTPPNVKAELRRLIVRVGMLQILDSGRGAQRRAGRDRALVRDREDRAEIRARTGGLGALHVAVDIPLYYYRENVDGILTVLEAMHALWEDLARTPFESPAARERRRG